MTAFRLIDAHSAAEAVALLRAHAPQAQPVAAGGDLLGLLKEGVPRPAGPGPRVLVNLATADELHRIERHAQGWSLGAMATLSALARVTGLPPMLAEAIEHIASPQLRARTTLGGNLLQRPRCLYFRHPDEACFKKGGAGCPSVGGPLQAYGGALLPGACHAGHPSDLAPVLLVLQAHAEIRGPAGVRLLPLTGLWDGAAQRADAETILARDELLVRLHLPHATDEAQAFEKAAPRDANEFATASAAAAGALHAGRWQSLRIALAGVAPAPLWLDTDAVIGQPADPRGDAALAARLLPAPERAPYDARLPAARAVVAGVLRRLRRAAD